jgi:acetoin utilization deacetylase AcuC-like enzyme
VKKTIIIYSKEFNRHNNNGHPENSLRTKVMLDEIKNSIFSDEIEFIKPEIISKESIKNIHSNEMINQIIERSTGKESWIDLDTYISYNDYETARLAAGGALLACKNVLDGKANSAFALVRPPGHHATINRSMGFCLFNNASLAANEISKSGKKILIFDPDVHHGNGTQDIFYDRNDILYQSFHLYPHFPGTGMIEDIGVGRGKGYNINAPLSYGNGNKAVSKLLDEIFIPIARKFNPDLIIFSSGFDSHHSDPLGGLKLTANFFGELISKFQEIQPKIVCTLEGGYNLQWIGKCLASQISHLCNKPLKFNDNAYEKINVNQIIKKLKDELGAYWNI